MDDKRFPGPLTDKQIEAHLDRHQALPPHGHSPEALKQIRQYQAWRVEEGNRRAKVERQARLKREATEKERRRKVVQTCKPKIELVRKVLTRRGGGVVVKCHVTNGDTGIQAHYVHTRPLGAHGWTRHGSAISASHTEPATHTVLGLVPTRTYQIAILTEHTYGDIMSDPITVSFSEADKPKPAPKPPAPEPDPDPPTDEQIQAYLDGTTKLDNHTHPIVRNAVNRYQRRKQEERNAREAIAAAERRVENERKYREYKKHGARLARLRKTPPRIKVLRRRIWVSGIQVQVNMERGSTAESVYLLVDTGDKQVAVGTHISPANLPHTRWLTVGVGRAKVVAIARNKYGSADSEPVEAWPPPSTRMLNIMAACRTYTGRRLKWSDGPYLRDLISHAGMGYIESDERHEAHWRVTNEN